MEKNVVVPVISMLNIYNNKEVKREIEGHA